MEFIIHRVNKIKDLKLLPTKFGAEIDIRSNGSKIILNHDPFKNGDELKNWIQETKNNLKTDEKFTRIIPWKLVQYSCIKIYKFSPFIKLIISEKLQMRTALSHLNISF